MIFEDIFTVLNAEEVLPGARGYFANTKKGLQRAVNAGWDQTLAHVDTNSPTPFCVEGALYQYALFLPLECVRGSES